MKKKFVHLCEEFEYTWIGKDNGMIPIYAKEVLGYEAEIITCNLKNDLPDEIRGVKIVKIPRFIRNIRNFLPFIIFIKRLPTHYYLIKNAKKIDILMLFHITKCSYWNAFFYKRFNPNGKIYIKCDFNLDVYRKEIARTEMKPKNLREYFRKNREIKEYNKRKKLVQMSDKISYETTNNYEVMKNEYAGVSTEGKVIYLPNGYDDLDIKENYSIKKMGEKENIFITVGRLGTYEKNTEMLLNSLSKVELKNWKFYFIGSIEETFHSKIEEFYKKNPDKKDRVVFTGEIKSKKELYEYYNRAKVFVLSSRYESFGIVLVEALAFNNYILSTDTGAIRDILSNNAGDIIDENNLVEKIKNIVNNNADIDTKNNMVDDFKYSNIIKRLEKI